MFASYLQEAGYDVYVNDAQLLPEGEEKHLISVFVADESGIINRVAGVFARRGVIPRFCTFLPSLCHLPAELHISPSDRYTIFIFLLDSLAGSISEDLCGTM